MSFCLNPTSYDSRALIDAIGEKAAYHVVHLNKGNELSKAPNGSESNLFRELYTYTGGFDKAMSLKAKFYTKRFFDTYGNWIESKQDNTDDNGEPKFSHYVDKLDIKTQVENETGGFSSVKKQDTYHAAKTALTPILNQLQNTYNLPWEEDNNLDASAGYVDGTIKVNFQYITPEAAFHEYAHPIVLLVKSIDMSAYNRLAAEAMRHTDIVNEVKNQYKHLDKEGLRDEIVTSVIGKYATEAFTEGKQTKGLLVAVKQFLDSVTRIFNQVLGLKRQISRTDLASMNLREMGFMMGTATPQLDLGAVQKAYEDLQNRGKMVNGKLHVEFKDRDVINGYREVLGWENVRTVKSPNTDNGTYVMEIRNPLSTDGEILLKMKAAKEEPKGPKYESTKEGFLDDLVKTFDEKISVLRNQLRGELDKASQLRYGRDIRFYSDIINNFYSTTNARTGVEVIASELGRLSKTLDKKLPIAEIESAIKMLNGFDVVDKYFNKFNTTGSIINTLQQIKLDTSTLRNAYTDKLFKAAKDEMIDDGVSAGVASTLTDPVKDINAASLQTIGASFAQNSVEQAGDYLIRKSAFESNEETRSFNSKLEEKARPFNGNYSFILTKDAEGNAVPITKMNRDFIDKVQSIKSQIRETNTGTIEMRKELRELEKQLSILQSNGGTVEAQQSLYNKIKEKRNEITGVRVKGKTWNDYHRLLQEHFDYVLTPEKKAEYDEFIKDHAENYKKIDENGNEYFDEKAFKKEVDHYNPEHFQQYLAGKRKLPNAGAMWFDMVPKAGSTTKLYSNEYRGLSQAQKEFYDFFTESFYEATNNIFVDYHNDDLNMDAAIRDFISMPAEQKEKMKYSETVKNWMQDLITVPDGPEELDTHGVFSGLNRKNIKFKNVQQFMDHKKSLDQQDVVSVLKQYHAASVAHKYKKNVEDILNATSEIAFHVGKKDTTNQDEVKKDIFGNDKAVPATSNVYKRLRHTIDNYLYADTKERTSSDKIVDMINDFTRLRQMGLNPFSGFSNLAMGTINNWTYAKRNEFFNETDLRKAYWRLKSSIGKTASFDKIESSDAKKIALLADKFGVHDKLMEKHLKNKLMDKAFVFQERGEYLNHMSVIIAILENDKLSKDIVDRSGAKKTMFDVFKVNNNALELDNENFDLEKLGIDNKKIFNIIQGVNKINKEIHGDYDPLNPMYMKRTAFGRVISTFRTWLPMAVKTRFEGERRDEQLSAMLGEDVMRKGRYISVKDLIMKEAGIGGKAKATAKLAGNLLVGLIPYVDGKYGPNSQISDHDAANINQTLSEARVVILLSVLIACLGKLHDDGDDKNAQSTFNFFYNMSNRMENEMSFFYYPSNGTRFFKDLVPAVETFTQMGKVGTRLFDLTMDPEQDIYKRGFRKGTSKFWKEVQILTPGIKQLQSAWSIVSQQYGNTNYKK